MADNSKKKLRRATFVYWFLLFYIVAALVWWFISLEGQNDDITALRIAILKEQVITDTAKYEAQYRQILNEQQRDTTKYISEGITFLLLTLVGAAFVYRSVRNQFRLQKQQQNFMMAVTHELKTPISVIRLNLETLQKHVLDQEKKQKIYSTALQETTRLNDLTNNILVSSQLEGDQYKPSNELTDLSALVLQRMADFEKRFTNRQFICQVTEGIMVNGDELLLQMLVNNLVLNAVKYSPDNKPVTALLHKQANKIQLSIADEGEGIPDTEKQKIFEKFYRIGNEMTRKAYGTGLGLYLCKKIAGAHHAAIHVSDNKPEGSIFTVQFR